MAAGDAQDPHNNADAKSPVSSAPPNQRPPSNTMNGMVDMRGF